MTDVRIGGVDVEVADQDGGNIQLGGLRIETPDQDGGQLRLGGFRIEAANVDGSIAVGVLELELDGSSVLVTWDTIPGEEYQLYRGSLLIATTTEQAFVDISPMQDAWNTYKLVVLRPAYEEYLAEIFVPLVIEPMGPPGIHLWVNDVEVDCSHILDDIRITGAGKGYTSTPIPNAASIKLLDNFDAEIGQVVKLSVNGYTRFWGRITDVAVSWDDRTTQLTALGPLENLGWSDLPATVEMYTDYQRVWEVLTSVYGWIGIVVPNSGFHTHDLIPVLPKQTALDAMEDVCVSSESRIYERPDGTIVWQPKDLRLGTPTHVLDQCYLLTSSEWSQESEDVVNEITYTYGDGDEYTASIPVDYQWQRRKITIDTQLSNLSDVELHANDMVAARSQRTWRFPQLTVKVHTTPSDVVADMLTWEVGDKLRVVWESGPLPEVYGTIEGWEEYLTPTEWYVSWWVQGGQFLPTFQLEAAPTATTVVLTWNDWGPASEYRVFRDDVLIATVDDLTLTYTDTGRAQNTQYTYRVEAWYNVIETEYITAQDTVTTRTLVDLTPPAAAITYIGPHNGLTRVTVTHPGTNLDHLRIVVKKGSKPAHNSDGTVYNVAPGTHNLAGPGTGTRSKSVWYVAVYAVNGSSNYSNPVYASTTFIENPVVRIPTLRNAWGPTYGWEDQARVRAGNTSSNTYRGIWIIPQFNMSGYAIQSARLLVYRKDGGPYGAMPVPVGTHTYTSQPATPTISNVAWRGSVARNSSAWIDVTSLAAGLANGTYKGLGVAYDTTDVNKTYVGQPQTSDGRIEVFHKDKS